MKAAIALILAMSGLVAVQDPTPETRFAAVHVFIDAGDETLAAYQLEIDGGETGLVVVGVEGGAHAEFAVPPYYDLAAIQQERVIIGAFSIASETDLPRGRVRVATIHWEIDAGVMPELVTTLQAVATVHGREIFATVELEWEDRP